MLSHLILAVFPAAMILAAFNDVADFKIPNWVSIALAAMFPVAALLLGAGPREVLEALLLGCGCLVIGFAVFAARWCGGGDAKLFAATAPWVGLAGFVEFLWNMVISGAVMALVLMVFRKAPALPIYAQAPWVLRMHQRPNEMPYGVAIAAGGLLTFPHTSLFLAAFGG